MIAPIISVVINAVDQSTSFRDIVRAFSKYATISHISVDGFETKLGSKYNRVFVTIAQWNDTEETHQFIKNIRSGRARLNYWWDIQDNTTRKQINDYTTEEIRKAIEKQIIEQMMDEVKCDLDAEFFRLIEAENLRYKESEFNREGVEEISC